MPGNAVSLGVNPSDEAIRLGPLAVRFLITGDEFGGLRRGLRAPRAGRAAARGPRAQPRPLRGDDLRHRRELTWTVDGRQVEVGPGEALCIPRGAVHRFDNNGDQDVKALCLITPAAIGPRFFREAAAVIDAAAGGPPDPARMKAVMLAHGLAPAAPPPAA